MCHFVPPSLSDVPLSHYEYVQECRKFDRDVKLIMLLENEVDCSLARTVSNNKGAVIFCSIGGLGVINFWKKYKGVIKLLMTKIEGVIR